MINYVKKQKIILKLSDFWIILCVSHKNNESYMNLLLKSHLRAIFIVDPATRCSFWPLVLFMQIWPSALGCEQILTSLCPDISQKKLVARERINDLPRSPLCFSLISIPWKKSFPSILHLLPFAFQTVSLFLFQNLLRSNQNKNISQF